MRAEIDALQRLARAGVRVPETFGVMDGVLLMELIQGDDGMEAPRLGEIAMDHEQALEDYAIMLGYIVAMLCEGLIHGDLSEFNVLVDAHGPGSSICRRRSRPQPTTARRSSSCAT